MIMHPQLLLQLLTLFLLLTQSLSCSYEAPEVLDTFWQLNLVEESPGGQVHEELTVFVLVNGDSNDMSGLRIEHPEEDLTWDLRPEQWSRIEREGETWVGSNGIVMPGPDPLPRGEYLLRLADISGQTAEVSLFLAPAIGRGVRQEELFPSYTASIPSVEGPVDEFLLSLYGDDDKHRSLIVNKEELSRELIEQWDQQGYEELRLFYYEPRYGLGFVSARYQILE